MAVTVAMMNIGIVRVFVAERYMSVQVQVRLCHGVIVAVLVMVIMIMLVLMLNLFMTVLMLMSFREM